MPSSVEIVSDKPARALSHDVIEKDKPAVTGLRSVWLAQLDARSSDGGQPGRLGTIAVQVDATCICAESRRSPDF
jgi:shikimate kinase